MRFKVAAAIAMFVAVAATTASPGVVITEKVDSNTPTPHKGEQTMMIQGNRRKVITKDRIIITDLDGSMLWALDPAKKAGANIDLPPKGVLLTIMSKEGMSVELKKAAGTHKVAGYDCQDYEGTQRLGRYDLKVTECVASAAPGAKEYVAFTKAMNAKFKGTPIENKGEVPDGLPVSSTVSASLIPFPIPKNFPPDLTAKVKESNAKVKPEFTQTTITKVEVKNIPEGEFVVPAEYLKPKTKPVFKSGVPGGPNPPIPAPEQPVPPTAKPSPLPSAH
jgi:hypothetical protein